MGVDTESLKYQHLNLQQLGAALHRCSYKKVFWKNAKELQENIHVEVWLL